MRLEKPQLKSVFNVAISSNVFNFDRENDRKVSKYDIQDVHKWILKNAPVGTQRLQPNIGAFIYTGEEWWLKNRLGSGEVAAL